MDITSKINVVVTKAELSDVEIHQLAGSVFTDVDLFSDGIDKFGIRFKIGNLYDGDPIPAIQQLVPGL